MARPLDRIPAESRRFWLGLSGDHAPRARVARLLRHLERDRIPLSGDAAYYH